MPSKKTKRKAAAKSASAKALAAKNAALMDIAFPRTFDALVRQGEARDARIQQGFATTHVNQQNLLDGQGTIATGIQEIAANMAIQVMDKKKLIADRERALRHAKMSSRKLKSLKRKFRESESRPLNLGVAMSSTSGHDSDNSGSSSSSSSSSSSTADYHVEARGTKARRKKAERTHIENQRSSRTRR